MGNFIARNPLHIAAHGGLVDPLHAADELREAEHGELHAELLLHGKCVGGHRKKPRRIAADRAELGAR